MTVALLLAAALAAPSGQSPPLLAWPIACRPGRDCEIQNLVDRDPGPEARDYRCGTLTYQAHSGVDIRLLDMAAQRRGVAVLAAADGRVLRTRDDVPDISVRQLAAGTVDGRECGNGLVIAHAGGLTTQYCHMARGSLMVKPGEAVKAGDILGKVGLSGATEYPHLHLTVRRGADVIDPFAPDPGVGGSCGSGAGLWLPAAADMAAYKPGAILNTGFASGPVDMTAIEDGTILPLTPSAAAMVAYVRAIGLKAGDQQILTLSAPDGRVLAESKAEPLPRAQAQRLLYVGKPRPSSGWSRGRYEASYRIIRKGQIVAERRWGVTF